MHLCSPKSCVMKSFFLSAFIFLVAGLASAQVGDLMVKSGDQGMYLDHKVAPRESFFAIGRLYNLTPAELAAYNKLDLNKGLLIGQVLRIPLNENNFTQTGNSGTPVYHKVAPNEGLIRISRLNNDVPLTHLKGWNKLTSDQVRAGSKLVVGFVKSTALAKVTLPAPLKETEIAEIKPVEEKNEEVVAEIKPVVKEEAKPEVKEEPKQEVKEEPQKVEPAFAKNEEKTAVSENGYFKYHFDQQIKNTPVTKEAMLTSGIFKTTSGWLDAKYYLLMDGVQPGTIVKVVNPTNNTAIYAKVLGEMAGIRQNEGFDIRISSAAASALKVTEEDKFIVKANW